VRGRDLVSLDGDRYRRSIVGLVFQLHNLLPHLSALANVEVAMFSNGLTHRQQSDKAKELIAAVGLGPKEGAKPPRLAGGERQRLAIARALANDPSILLADEPTGSLDTESAQRVLELFTVIRRARGLTILMVTHDMHVASAAERVVSMRDGRIVNERPS
jgi:putative ABC transport system ATP-binding protein